MDDEGSAMGWRGESVEYSPITFYVGAFLLRVVWRLEVGRSGGSGGLVVWWVRCGAWDRGIEIPPPRVALVMIIMLYSALGWVSLTYYDWF